MDAKTKIVNLINNTDLENPESVIEAIVKAYNMGHSDGKVEIACELKDILAEYKEEIKKLTNIPFD